MDERIQELTAQIEALTQRLEGASPEDQKALGEQVTELQEQVAELLEQREADASAANVKAMKDQIDTLTAALEQARTPGELFSFGTKAVDTDSAYEDGERSYFADLAAASKGRTPALERIAKLGAADEKAMTEGTSSAGGYLVPTHIDNNLIDLRYRANVMRRLCSNLQVTTNKVQMTRVVSGLTAEWVEELAEKPEGELVFGQFTTDVFTAAGLAAVSNQLLADSRPGIDGLIATDLARQLAKLEEAAFIDGDGSGKPTGILNTAGISDTALTDPNVTEILDAIYLALTSVDTELLDSATAILMAPEVWYYIERERPDSEIQYLIGAGANSEGRRPSDQRPSRTLFGYPVELSAGVPVDQGAGDDTTVIVGNFAEAVIIDREGIVLDSSEHVHFTTNQTIFRAEERVGFTAERRPEAFHTVSGIDLSELAA